MAVILYVCLFVASCLTPVIIGGEHLVGGYANAEPNRPDVKEASDFAVKAYNKVSNDAYLYKPLSIVSAQTQVVAGTNYKLTMEIGKTQCRKNNVGDGANGGVCDVANSEVSQMRTCTFVVFISLPQPTPEFELSKYECKSESEDTGSEE
ncbi:cystatin-POGU1-like [Bufo bufo]|uniref:cystatin-POGU1-like n=1 Tax=Bufo bufo TaxID=8384 RepID=UPI001ABDE518|nr:cystatin-POGU1-like [Bufo bufo]XP_040285594.1 cystatin-POGU1-like [Bufo bufo]